MSDCTAEAKWIYALDLFLKCYFPNIVLKHFSSKIHVINMQHSGWGRARERGNPVRNGVGCTSQDNKGRLKREEKGKIRVRKNIKLKL